MYLGATVLRNLSYLLLWSRIFLTQVNILMEIPNRMPLAPKVYGAFYE